MPAINPPTGLGGLLPFGGAPLSYPTIGIQAANANPYVQQTATAFTTVSGPTSFTLPCAATLVGSQLIALIAINASGGAAAGPAPAGWALNWFSITAGSTLLLACYVFQNNPGGITSFALSGPTATAGGIAGILYEVPNCPFASDSNLSNTGTSTTPASGVQLVPPATNNIVLGAVAWIAGAVTLTPGNTVPTGTIQTTTAQVTSTTGATNAALRGTIAFQPAMASTASTGFIIGGTLSASVGWCAGCFNLRSLVSDYSVGSADVDATKPGFAIVAGGQQAISTGAL